MYKIQKILIITALIISLAFPATSFALEMPSALNVAQSGDMSALTAQAYIVVDQQDNSVLLQKNINMPWTPASLTKLVTALVFLDTKPNMKRIVTIKQSDQTGGGCTAGGACILTKPGISYRLDDLFHASLIASANNATMAVARSTGLTQDVFVRKMNQKAISLGAANTHFVEPTGMDPANSTTVSDYAKIAAAAFANPTIHAIDITSTYVFNATNSSRYATTIKNTNKLLVDADVIVRGGKTGYLEESKYNFVTQLTDGAGNNLVVVLFGSQNGSTEFSETKQLAETAGLIKSFGSQSQVLGTSTRVSVNNN